MRMSSITLSSEVFNPVYIDVLFNRVRFLHLWGGAGSGKSYFAAQKIIYRMLSDIGFRCLVIRKVARTIRRSCFQELINVIHHWNLSHLFNVSKSRLEIECLINGNTIICEGIDNNEKLKSISGVSSIWVEEATELTYDDFAELNRRLRGETRCYKQIILSYNPISFYHWINQKIHIGKGYEDRTYLLHTTYRDNLFLDQESIIELEQQGLLSPTHADIFREGKWSVPKNVIYSNYSFSESAWNGTPVEECYGIDFGMNSPLSVVRVEWEDMRTVHVKEIEYGTGISDSYLYDILSDSIPTDKRYIPIYCDSAEPNRIQELKMKGFNALPANKLVRDGIRYVQQNKLIIEPGSPNIEEEIRLYEWKEYNGVILDEPIKLRDHSLDAIRYAIYTHGLKYIVPREQSMSNSPLSYKRIKETNGLASPMGRTSKGRLKGFR